MTGARTTYLQNFVIESLGLPEQSEIALDSPVDTNIVADCLSGQANDSLKRDPIRPVVDQTLEKFRNRLRDAARASQRPFVYKWFWPDGKPYAICLTHDADKFSESIGHIWKVRKRFSLPTLLGAFLGVTNPYLNLRRISDLEHRYGVRSSFYLRTKSYNLERISSTLAELVRGGWEVGLHFDLEDGDGLDELKRQTQGLRAVLGQEVRGNRCHYLKFSYPETWESLDAAGYLYDTTCGFRDEVGFRVGTCLPYHPPSGSWTRLRLLELPLTLMDTTLWGYKKLTEAEGLQLLDQALTAVSGVNGLFTLLWHQCALMMRGGRIYSDILDRISRENCWIAKASEVAEWWIRRESARLRLEGLGGRSLLSVESPASLAGLSIRIENADITRYSGDGPLTCRKADSFTEVAFSGGNSASIELSS